MSHQQQPQQQFQQQPQHYQQQQQQLQQPHQYQTQRQPQQQISRFALEPSYAPSAQSEWTHGLCSCCGDCSVLCGFVFCTWCLIGKTGFSLEGNNNPTAFQWCFNEHNAVVNRYNVERKYNIKPMPQPWECCICTVCVPCNIMQVAREVKHRQKLEKRQMMAPPQQQQMGAPYAGQQPGAQYIVQ